MRVLNLHICHGPLITPSGAGAVRIKAGKGYGRNTEHTGVSGGINGFGQNFAGSQNL